jgi:fumarate hydratase class I
MKEVLAELSKYPVKTWLILNGILIVTHDIAHSHINQMIESSKPINYYIKNHPIYYADPAKTPEGMPSSASERPPLAA